VIARYRMSASRSGRPGSGMILLSETQPFGNHNGGNCASARMASCTSRSATGIGGDPLNNGQRLDSILGKLLRIDVDSSLPYAIHRQPFCRQPGCARRIWARASSEPVRFSFDRQTGDLFVADVGQALGEIDYQAAGDPAARTTVALDGGAALLHPSSGCDTGSLTLPIVEYSHSLGCSVRGIDTGALLPSYVGTYFFSTTARQTVGATRTRTAPGRSRSSWTPRSRVPRSARTRRRDLRVELPHQEAPVSARFDHLSSAV